MQAVVADKRLDVLLKQEIREQQHLISCHHREMQELRDKIQLAMERFESLFQKCSAEMTEFKNYTDNNVRILTDKQVLQEKSIANQEQIIRSIQDLHSEYQFTYVTQADVNKINKVFESQVRESASMHLLELQILQREVNRLIESLKDDLSTLRIDMDEKLDDLKSHVASNYSVLRIDKDSVLKQIRVYERSMFIIEKKIENIYTLIERMNKRGADSCHKPE